ncbi:MULTISPECIES: DUF1631 domain-containing protein [unclassified Pseudomonas]|uniref:DUF1631 domain-containing protein n=1 Tax=unclassified Pseudomonas TaxID=196821 RepID=UPI000BD88EBA|nr:MULTISPECIES: DUF1631 domain-containing protein [unclassified Pseudomonas]PVZ11268.1 uncharacterized protein DUF1631 [Pseudomonas sp. URIL14HWK12:I12]PVZ22266.1 uncharacterized protein DUF1631 [Pseudomonas sp. URIL14HWK12:I10]PVZ31610.1 uncharacterized protein DUF1631 [Pseudomonas sp. URIL14HWK12:I11]SNZ16633.1 Protein of unknown function [Pseudomonas sp. URIL14HWK12:I9]
MQNDGKVVHLNAAADLAASAPLARLPVVVLQVRDKAAQQLREGLQALFDNADDTLFEMADKASSNNEQNLFFEAMRDLRLKRKNIERGFLDKFYEAFVRVGQYDVGQARPAPMNYDKLALVPNEELERTVALDSMVNKVLARDGLALTQLTTRLNALVPRVLTDDSNPLGPAMLCDYFVQAGQTLGVEIKVKLIILKLFDRYVLADTDHLYFDANQLLIATGILPELKVAPARRADDRPGRRRAPEDDNAPAQVAPLEEPLEESVREVFTALQELVHQVRSLKPARREPAATVLPISTNDLMRLLSHLQQYVPQQPEQAEDYDLRMQLEQLLNRVSLKSGKARVVGTVDEDVINLVAMLFEFILDDRNLPDSLRALIGRLQIPILKVAVLDKSFFARSNHPARRLLNEIAQAAMGWSGRDDFQRDALHGRIDQIVQRLLNDFVDDTSLFSELLVDFLAFTAEERRRSELLEQRTRDAEEGRARAELARLHVQFELNRRLLGKTLPQVVVRLLEEAWSKVLLLTWLKHGEQAPEWQAALATMDDLVWSVEPHDGAQARNRLLSLVPGLLKALREGLTSAAFDPFATSDFFSQLETLHVQAIQRTSLTEATLQADDDIALVKVESEIVLDGQGPAKAPDAPPALPEADPAVQQAAALRPGTWVELLEEDGEPLRCKLTTIIESTGKYVFVNRTGMKVLERTAASLALAIQRNELRVLDDNLLVDRAMDAVVGRLRLLKSA